MIIKRNCKFRTTRFDEHPSKNQGIVFTHEGENHGIFGYSAQIYKLHEVSEPWSFKRFSKRLAAEFIESMPIVFEEGPLNEQEK